MECGVLGAGGCSLLERAGVGAELARPSQVSCPLHSPGPVLITKRVAVSLARH